MMGMQSLESQLSYSEVQLCSFKFFDMIIFKEYRPSSDCSKRSSLIRINIFFYSNYLLDSLQYSRGMIYEGLSGQFFRNFEIEFCFVVPIIDLVHDLEAIHGL